MEALRRSRSARNRAGTEGIALDDRTRSKLHKWPLLALLVLSLVVWFLGLNISNRTEAVQKAPLVAATSAATKLPQTAASYTPYTTTPAFAAFKFTDPTFVISFPNDPGCFLVLERRGRIQRMQPSPTGYEQKQFLDITDRVIEGRSSGEDGLSGIALHPEFAIQGSAHFGEFFLHYTTHGNGRRGVRLSKFCLPRGSDVADPNSEVVLIDQQDEISGHNGGTVLFGPDGFLYFTVGDDDVRHPNKHAQHIDQDLFSGVLRIDTDCRGGDVSHPPPRQPNTGKTAHYYIPNDNPWVGVPNALEEFYAIGLRNPWRASFDRQTGKLWVTDVGERRREEVNVVEKGSNCGWSYVEGTLLSKSHRPKALGRPEHYLGKETWPVYEYERENLDRCIVGGYVYRGKQFPELVGKYVYADLSGRIYALEFDENYKVVAKSLASVVEVDGLGVASLAEDGDGELFVCVIRRLGEKDSLIYRLIRADVSESKKLPELLSQTGLFKDLKKLKPASGFVSYEVNSPLWSDRAEKFRWIKLPPGKKIGGKKQGPWEFPIGTVFVKHFELPLDASEDGEEKVASKTMEAETSFEITPPVHNSRRLETRVLVRDVEGGYYGATYRWNKDQTDAYLVENSQTEEMEYFEPDGTKQTQTWLYPGRFDCMACHNPLANFVLGFSAKQLNRETTVDGKTQNQLIRFTKKGMFEAKIRQADLEKLPRLAGLADSHATLEHRVRSYLDSNCAHCHRRELAIGGLDGRFEQPLSKQHLVDRVAFMHLFADEMAKVVKPGDLEHSYLYLRMKADSPHMRMPPLGRHVVHEDAVKLMEAWIQSLPRSPETVTQKDQTPTRQDTKTQ